MINVSASAAKQQIWIGKRLFWMAGEDASPLLMTLQFATDGMADSDVDDVFAQYGVTLDGYVNEADTAKTVFVQNGVTTAAWDALPKKP